MGARLRQAARGLRQSVDMQTRAGARARFAPWLATWRCFRALVKDATAAMAPEMMHSAHVLNATFATAILTTAELIPRLGA